MDGVSDRSVVCDDAEVSRFQHIAEMFYGLIDCQQLAIM
jgi:hypothetical protein